MRAKTIKINENFICLQCHTEVSSAQKTCRNHCPHCLWSLHVDGDIPGDRASDCNQLMEPVGIEHCGKGYMIVHKCTQCHQQKRNRMAPDDNWNLIIELSQYT